METKPTVIEQSPTIRKKLIKCLETDLVKQKFTEILGKKKKSNGFIASVLQIAASNELFAKAEPSVYI